MSKRVRVKLLVVLFLVVSAVGLAGKSSACGAQCAVVLDSHGHVVGYGCAFASNHQDCQANQTGCTLFGC